jgi:hypothetical protein
MDNQLLQLFLQPNDLEDDLEVRAAIVSVASAQLSLFFAFFFFFFCFFITENAIIDVAVREMVSNIAPLHNFQIIQIHAANLEIFKE